MPRVQSIAPCLWFDKQAEDAAKFYTSIFPNSKIGRISRYGTEGHEIHKMPAGSVMTVAFDLAGHKFTALNGGPLFKFNEAISLQVFCETQEEIDYFWEKLREGGDPKAEQCGWLKDKFGLSWQVSPVILDDMVQNGDDPKAARALRAMFKMKKLDIAALKKAYDG